MVTLIILDGFGINKKTFGNAILSAGTPNLDNLKKRYFSTILKASGDSVGLPKGQMGNSEVGHLTIGSGRIILQDLLKINNEINTKNILKNNQLIKAINHAKNNNSALHLMGLLSDGGVHSHINHLFFLIDYAKEMGIKKVYIHPFLDGRDTPINSGEKYIKTLQEKIKNTSFKIASLSGRIYSMDREKRFDRLEKSYKTLIFGENYQNKTPLEIVKESYKNGVFDQFMQPVLLEKEGVIKENDSVIFFNFRSDRAIELTDAITNPKFKEFKTQKFNNLLFSPMELYSEKFKDLNVIFPPQKIQDNLSAILSEKGLKQFHISETTKYAHVTFFFNGGIEEAYKGEERKLIESVDTQDFSYYPKMKALEITEETLDAIASAKYDFILVNLSNPDMIGHTGNFQATKEAIQCVDKCAYAITLATLMAGGECIITADHGNAESMIDEKGNPITSHTNNPVPFILASEKGKYKLKKNMSIANIAPTILKLLDIEIPKTMEKPLF